MSGEFSGIGAELRRWNSGIGQWVKIANVKNIGGPNMTRATLDTTTLDTAGGYRTFIAGLRDAGSIQMTVNFTRDGYEIMKDDFESDVVQNYEIFLPDDDETSLEFSGLVTEIPLTISEDVVTYQCTIKISGQVELESGSGS
jgi:predicted secreted protein